jgi:hypothetical protein
LQQLFCGPPMARGGTGMICGPDCGLIGLVAPGLSQPMHGGGPVYRRADGRSVAAQTAGQLLRWRLRKRALTRSKSARSLDDRLRMPVS